MARSANPEQEESEVMSPEHRVRYLLRSTVKRRTTLLPNDAPTEATEAESAWQINSVDQLVHWSRHEPEKVLEVLNSLRQDRDTALKCLNHWDAMEMKIQEATERAILDSDTIYDLRQQLRDRAAKNLKLRQDLKEALQLGDEARTSTQAPPRAMLQPSAPQSPITTPRSESTQASSKRKSTRYPDPPMFTNGEDPTYVDWSLSIQDKLHVNADHFVDDAAQAIYVISRTSGDAAGHINAYRTGGKAGFFTTPLAVLGVLEDVYGDPDRERNARRIYSKLRQRVKQSFNVFYSEFKKQTSYLKYDERTLIDDLKEKIIMRLRETLSIVVIDFSIMTKLKDYLQRINNNQRGLQQDKTRIERIRGRMSPRTVNPSSPALENTLLNPSPQRTSYLSRSITFGRLTQSMTSRILYVQNDFSCYKCDIAGHIAKDCPGDTGKISPAPARIHEVDAADEDPEAEDPEHDSEDSKNY